MPHEYKLTIVDKRTDESIVSTGTFDDNDWECLENYVKYADELLATTFIQDGANFSFELKGDSQSGTVIESNLPPWNEVTIFLHKFRPVGLQSEETYFHKVCNILTKRIVEQVFRSMVQEQRDIFSGKRMQEVFRIQIGEIILNSEKVLFDWLNAYEYHREKDKRKFIEGLHTIFPLDASKVLFLSLLYDKFQAINNLASIIRVVIRRQDYVECEVRC